MEGGEEALVGGGEEGLWGVGRKVGRASGKVFSENHYF